MRVRLILDWFFAIILDQVNPYAQDPFVSPSLWPGWDWGWLNAIQSHSASPWEPNRYRFLYTDDDEDDDYDADDYCFEDWL